MEGFPESLRGYFRGVSDDIRRAFFARAGLQLELGTKTKHSEPPYLELSRELQAGNRSVNAASSQNIADHPERKTRRARVPTRE